MDLLTEWKALRRLVRLGDVDEEVELTIKLFLNKINMNEDQDAVFGPQQAQLQENKYATAKDFEMNPTMVKVLAFERVEGGKYVDKYGKTNVLTFDINGKEKVLNISTYAFGKAFKESGCRPGDMAMLFTLGFLDPINQRPYRYWIIQKLGENRPDSEQPLVAGTAITPQQPRIQQSEPLPVIKWD